MSASCRTRAVVQQQHEDVIHFRGQKAGNTRLQIQADSFTVSLRRSEDDDPAPAV